MVRPGNEVDSSYSTSPDDDVGRVIRWGLNDAISGAEPPAHVWPRILERVGDLPAPARSKRSFGSSFPVAPFVQAVVVSALLLAFGLGVDRGVVLPRRQYRVESTPTIRRARAAEDSVGDVLRGYMLRQQPELPVRQGGNIR